MKLAKKAYVVTLVLLMLAFAASAQKSDKDDRNTAPTVGTGGPVGGPTGLFTVYDASTLRKGEYTLSAALSNYDRDPGNADISSVPLSFQIGLSNRFELFFTTEGYRGIKVNSPANLSSFYLPNSQLRTSTGVITRPAAIVLEPGTGTRAIFRPAGAPFIGFPYTGAFYSPAIIGLTNTIGPPRVGGAADLFPGVGSVYGSILPGVVLSTTTLASGAVIPASFTNVPSYLPDAPFINRTWGTSSFNSMVLGAKWRFNDSKSAAGWGVSAFYRWYMDSASDASGWNQMQRGSGPGSGGGWKGDAGVTLFADARVAKWANVSGNIGYVYTSKTKGDFGGGEFILLDRPDEFQWSVGADFPVNRYFQPILEFRSLTYVGGRTPNVLEQDPLDGIAGFRVYPQRWFGFGLAYRYNFNQQDTDYFNDFRNISAVTVLCPTGAPTNCVGATTTSSTTGVPAGLNTSSDPHGYIAQFWVGRRDKRAGDVVNVPANVESVTLSDTTITLPCPPGTTSASGSCSDSSTISVSTKATDPENDVLTYNYTVSGGRIVGTGANVQWDLSTATAGTYTITTGVDDGCGVCGRTDTKTITIVACPDCKEPARPCTCPTLSISGPSGVTQPGEAMTFTANVSGGDSLTYNWTVSAGTIESGQGTPSITVRTTRDMANSNVTATLNIGGTDPACNCQKEISDSGSVAALPSNITVDEFGPVANDDLKARIDNFYVQLGNNPGAQGYIINYGTAAEIKKRNAVINAHIRMRGLDASRVTFIEGPSDGSGIRTKLIISPPGAPQVTP